MLLLLLEYSKRQKILCCKQNTQEHFYLQPTKKEKFSLTSRHHRQTKCFSNAPMNHSPVNFLFNKLSFSNEAGNGIDLYTRYVSLFNSSTQPFNCINAIRWISHSFAFTLKTHIRQILWMFDKNELRCDRIEQQQQQQLVYGRHIEYRSTLNLWSIVRFIG